MTTLSDVARRAGVAVSTVSKVLNGAPGVRVSVDTRQRIEAAARELEYRPSFAARALKSARSQTLAVVVPDLRTGIAAPLVYGAEAEARRSDYALFLGRSEEVAADVTQLRRMADEGRIDGIILQLAPGTPRERVDELVQLRVPIACVGGGEATESGEWLHLNCDEAAGAALATEHLLGLGHRDIGFIGGSAGDGAAERQRAGYRAALRARGVEPREAWEAQLGSSVADGARAVVDLQCRAAGLSGVVVGGVGAALGVLRAARELGLGVPSELSVVSVHDAVAAEHAWPQLTSVEMPLADLGARAVRALLERVGAPLAPELEPELPALPRLVVRESTAPPHN